MYQHLSNYNAQMTVLSGMVVIAAIFLASPSLFAQTIAIKLVDGRNGRPMAATCVNVWMGDERKAAMAIPTGENGIARLRLTDNDSETDVHNRWKGCGDFGIVNPVVKYDDSLHIHAGYVLCQLRKPDYSWLAIANL